MKKKRIAYLVLILFSGLFLFHVKSHLRERKDPSEKMPRYLEVRLLVLLKTMMVMAIKFLMPVGFQ